MDNDWEAFIMERTDIAKTCINTDFLNYTPAINKLQFVDGDLPPDASDAIKGINNTSADHATNAYKQFSDDVEKLRETEPNDDEWEKLLKNASRKAKETSNSIIDEAGKIARLLIGKLPQSQRMRAASLYDNGLQSVLEFMKQIWEGIGQILGAIVEFLAGIWTKITEVWEMIKAYAKQAKDAIFGGNF